MIRKTEVNEVKKVKEAKTATKTTKPQVTPPPKVYIPPPSYGEPEEIDSHDVYDEGDIASALERGFITQALNRHKLKVAAETHPDFDGESCLDCGAAIPLLRLQMGRMRCVDCQAELERRNKMFGR